MADVTIGAKITVDAGGATTSVKNFTQELKQAKQEVVAITQQFGPMSKEAAAAAQKVAGLQDAIGDAKSLVDAFNPDTKFKAFGATINTVVGGFTALQGVLGLVGVESQEVQKALLKVQSALALSQGLAQLQQGIQAFKNLGAVIQATTAFQKANNIVTAIATAIMRAFGASTVATSASMNVLKAAIISTGIGALVVLLGVVANAMGLFGDETDDAAASQEGLQKAIAKSNDELDRQLAQLSNAEKLALARLKLAGGTEEEIFQLEQEFRRKRFNATLQAFDRANGIDKAETLKKKQELEDINAEGEVAEINHQIRLADIKKKAREKEADDKKAADKAAADERAKELDAEAARFTARGGPAAGLNIEIPKSPEQIASENAVKAAHDGLAEKEKIFLAESDLRSKAFTDIKDKAKEEELIQKLKFENTQQILGQTSEALNAFSQLVGENTAAGKVFAIAAATIDTFKAVVGALASSPPPANYIQAAIVGALGIVNIKKIIAVKIPGKGTGGSAPTAAAVNAPLTPQKPLQGTTTLDQNSINALGSATTRSFVLESDISSSQERITRLNRAARLS
jgi:hypothetical protein